MPNVNRAPSRLIDGKIKHLENKLGFEKQEEVNVGCGGVNKVICR